MCRQVCSGGAADAKCLLTVHPSHAFQRNATTAPRNASQRYAKHISRIRQLSHSSGMPCVGELCSRHFARTSLSLRPRCIPAYTYFIPNGIMPPAILRQMSQITLLFQYYRHATSDGNQWLSSEKFYVCHKRQGEIRIHFAESGLNLWQKLRQMHLHWL